MPFAGFDRADMPPLDMMERLKHETNLAWCGFYLPAPSQSGKTWRGNRAKLAAMGWGLLPIFVGQQVVGPGSHNVTSTQGASDGSRACDAMRAEGFAPGSWVYLDLENGPPLPLALQAYAAAWIDAVEAGGFRAGVYCSFLFAGQIAALRPKARIWVFHVPTTAHHPVAGTVFPTPDPSKSGFPGAVVWQRDDEAVLTAFGGLVVDLDVSTMRDPGAPEAAAGGLAVPAVPIPAPPTPTPPAAPAASPVTAPAPTFLRRVANFFAAVFKRAA